jgi:xylulokinase
VDTSACGGGSREAGEGAVALSILTIDLGTTVCKMQTYDEEGLQTWSYSEEIETLHPRPGWSEQDPESWWPVVKRGFASLRGSTSAPPMIGGIGICSHRESILGIDDHGRVVIPSILWADRRCEAEAREIGVHFGGELHRRTGMKADPYFSAPKLLWAIRHRPGAMGKVRKILLPKDYLVYRLTGALSTDWSVASRTAMLDIRRGEWWGEMLDFIGLDEDLLCEPADPASPVGDVTLEVTRELGLGSRPVVVAGAGDRQCEALGSGVSVRRAMESTGSATNVSISTDRLPEILPGDLLCSCHALGGQYLIEQGIGSTGLALRWFRDTFTPPGNSDGFGDDPYAYIDGCAASSPPGARGLIFLPFLSGAQATRWNPDARGAFCGLTLGHGYSDVARSILEGIAYEIRAAMEVLDRADMRPEEILALGGSARSETWNRIKASVVGRTYCRPRVTGAASLGAFMLAMKGMGQDIPRADALNPVEGRYDPGKEAADYRACYSRYQSLYEALVPVFSKVQTFT